MSGSAATDGLFSLWYWQCPWRARRQSWASAPRAFDFSKTDAARHPPEDYFEKHVQNKDYYRRWMALYHELQAQLASKEPFTDEELLRDHMARTTETGKANILILPTDDRSGPGIRTGEVDNSAPGNPFYEGWVMCDNRYERIPAPAVVYNFQARFPAGMETVLYPTPAGVKAQVAVARKQSKGRTGAVLVTVTTPEATDRYIIARADGRHEFPDAGLVSEGRMAMVRTVDGKPTSIGLLGATLLEAEGLKVSAEVPTDASLDLSGGKWRIGDGKGAITLWAETKADWTAQ